MKVVEEGEIYLKHRQQNQLKEIHNKDLKNMYRSKDKSDHGTIEQCIDPRISRIIEKYKKRGQITEFNGCVATGKEANVYHAKGRGVKEEEDGIDPNRELAIKIYKTSILIFKDRERYITGEFRFRNGYCKSNPRKMVAVWCEKEMRNLKRIRQKGIKCPEPFAFKSNLIMMEFIGKDGIAAPRLKDALNEFENVEEFDDCYIQIMEIMKKMYQSCKLVHSDFSEYNLLYYNKDVYVIDLAQAVEENHPNADFFLKRDIHNMNEFFTKNSLDTLTDQQFYDFVVKKIKNCKEYVNKMREENKKNTENDAKYKIKQNDIFCQYEVPFNLMQLATDNMLDSKMDLEIALNNLVKRQKELEEKEKNNIGNDEEEESEEEESEESEEEDEKKEGEKKEKKKKYDPFEGMTKEERKKKVKEENRERRANKKFTKKEKKKLIKKSAFKTNKK